jgi:integrase
MALLEFVNESFKVGASRQSCVNLVSALALVAPWVDLHHAKKALKGWCRLEPTRSRRPVSKSIMEALAAVLIREGHVEAAAATLFAFDTYARHSEITNLLVGDLVFGGDPRLMRPSSLGAVFLRDTKTGSHQWVELRCPRLVRLLRLLVSNRPARDRVFFASLRSSPLLRLLKRAQVLLGFDSPPFVVHSLRHGGATHDFLQGVPTLDIAIRGRWASEKSLRTYISVWQAWLLEVHMSPVVRDRINAFTRSFSLTDL